MPRHSRGLWFGVIKLKSISLVFLAIRTKRCSSEQLSFIRSKPAKRTQFKILKNLKTKKLTKLIIKGQKCKTDSGLALIWDAEMMFVIGLIASSISRQLDFLGIPPSFKKSFRRENTQKTSFAIFYGEKKSS